MMKPLIMIGGMSGIGKTTLVNMLLEIYPKLFERPISYTTRNKRSSSDNEYIFVSEEELLDLELKGELVCIDKIYGYSYAMSLKSILEISNSGRFPIKEIHPSNQYKVGSIIGNHIKSILYPISSLNRLDNISNGRIIEDRNFYKSLKLEEFDIVIQIHEQDKTDDIMNDMISKIKSIDSYPNFPKPSIIDRKNINGYNKVSKEFTDTLRITTRDFHNISYSFFNRIINSLIPNALCLEIGSGNGWLRNSFSWNDNIVYHSTDISKNMNHNGYICSARSIPFQKEYFDIIFSSLGDPYFYPSTISEISRVLKKDGKFVFTLPSKLWSNGIARKSHNETSFIMKDGSKVDVYSFTFEYDELKSMLNEYGLIIESYVIGKIDQIDDTRNISHSILISSSNHNIPIRELNILDMVIARKI